MKSNLQFRGYPVVGPALAQHVTGRATSTPLKGLTDVGTAGAKYEGVMISSLIDGLNERFRTDFTGEDQFYLDQIRASAQNDKNIARIARANNFTNSSSYLDRMLGELLIARLEGNEEFFSRVMSDTEFRSVAHGYRA